MQRKPMLLQTPQTQIRYTVHWLWLLSMYCIKNWFSALPALTTGDNPIWRVNVDPICRLHDLESVNYKREGVKNRHFSPISDSLPYKFLGFQCRCKNIKKILSTV